MAASALLAGARMRFGFIDYPGLCMITSSTVTKAHRNPAQGIMEEWCGVNEIQERPKVYRRKGFSDASSAIKREPRSYPYIEPHQACKI